MFCGKCGVENRDGARFCKSCGQPLISNINNGQGINSQPQFQSQHQPQQYPSGYNTGNVYNPNMNQGVKKNPSQIVSKLKKVPIGAYIGGGVGVVALIVVIAFLVISGKTIDLNRYLKIETSGYNGYGTAKASIDWDTLKKEHGSDLSFTSAARQQYGGTSKIITPADIASSYISVVLDKNSNLSDGDTINYKWKIDDKLSRYVDGRITCSEGVFTVSNLNEIATFDAFADLSVEFSGISPNGKASIKYSGSVFSLNSFTCNKSAGLKNGDTIEISLNVDINSFAQKNGKAPETKTKQYTVSGLYEYISSGSELNDTFLNDIKKSSEDMIYSHIANLYYRTTISDLKYEGYYIIKRKDGNSYYGSAGNYLYLVYSGEVSTSSGKGGSAKAFFPVRFSNVLKRPDGKLEWTVDNTIVGQFVIPNTYGYIKGFISGEEMYKNIITKNRASYDYEVSDSLKQYGN